MQSRDHIRQVAPALHVAARNDLPRTEEDSTGKVYLLCLAK